MLSVEVAADEARNKATYDAIYWRNDVMVSKHRVTMNLERPGK